MSDARGSAPGGGRGEPEIAQILSGRERDLGGLHVARVLPAVHQRSVGPFLFLDHMGPEEAGEISVRPHPHIHLATVTYLFDGGIHHRDSLGSHQVIEPGAINWMNAGRGIVHSERSEGEKRVMHGLQLWVGLPTAQEDSDPTFVHYPAATLPTFVDGGAHARVLIGSPYGLSSPVVTKSPMFYVDVELAPGARLAVPDGEERAVYVVNGDVEIGDVALDRGHLAVFGRGAHPTLVGGGESGARVVLLGGEPLDGPRFMWWNFVSSSKERIVEAAHAWRAGGGGQFAKVPGDEAEYIPAPPEDPHFAS